MADSTNGRENITVIGPDTKITGEMEFESGARIMGRFDGRMTSAGTIEVAETAICRAEIEAERVEVDGNIVGNVVARDRLSLSKNAVVQGDIAAGTLTVEEGATFVGRCAVGPRAEEAAEGQPVAQRSRAAAPVQAEPKPAAKASIAPKATIASPASADDSATDGDESAEFRPPWKTRAEQKDEADVAKSA